MHVGKVVTGLAIGVGVVAGIAVLTGCGGAEYDPSVDTSESMRRASSTREFGLAREWSADALAGWYVGGWGQRKGPFHGIPVDDPASAAVRALAVTADELGDGDGLADTREVRGALQRFSGVGPIDGTDLRDLLSNLGSGNGGTFSGEHWRSYALAGAYVAEHGEQTSRGRMVDVIAAGEHGALAAAADARGVHDGYATFDEVYSLLDAGVLHSRIDAERMAEIRQTYNLR